MSSKYNRVCLYKDKFKVIPRSCHLMQLNQRYFAQIPNVSVSPLHNYT